MTVTTTALYRRYRPDSFADVIGQEHVTEPLMTALRKNRVNHAYLFSGPRGCGKTTSARILARCLNCAEGPTDTPCGVCPSCVELARGGSGSLDVIEIDAASHGGVDDARDLRERATYAPVRDRYKIFIIDEAHMVTSAGFNALLKIVEEPPEHIKFIFATTEPDKVIGTIRSRTHHYPFRLVPPEPLMAYLELLCRQENVPVAPGVLSLVIRAGGGSVRDSLSVLDQLMAGAGQNGLDYELAVALLGYTHASLLDDVVEAVAASDAATVFRAVDRVIQTGHDPRRFVEDLLERFRDLIIVQAMPESAQTILRGMPADQIARLQNQAHNLGAAELSRAADVTNTALTEMTGATSPRLHLELLCARILLPSSEQTERGIAARIDRVERRLNYAGNDVGAPAPAGSHVAAGSGAPERAADHAPAPAPAVSERPAPAPAASSAPARAADGLPAAVAPQEATPPQRSPQARAGETEARQPLTAPRVSTSDWPVDEPSGSRPAPASTAGPGDGARRPHMQDSPAQEPPAAAPATTDPAATAATGPAVPAALSPAAPVASQPGAMEPVPAVPVTAAPASATRVPAAAGPAGDVEVLRRAWPEVLQALSKIKRSTWALVEPNAQVSAFDGQLLTLAFTTSGLAGAFGRADHSDNLRQAIHKIVGIDCQINAVSGGSNSPASSEPNPKAPASREPQATSADVAWGLAPAGSAPEQDTAAPVPAAPPTAAAPVEATPASPSQPDSGPGLGTAHTASDQAVPDQAWSGQAGSSQIASGHSASGHSAAGRGAAGRGGGISTPEHPPAASPATPAVTPENAASPAPQPVPAPVVPARDADTAGTYAYSDDDWGPPRDEDAPPLDEEPPMDWDPTETAGPRRVPATPIGAPDHEDSSKPASKRGAGAGAGAGAAKASRAASAPVKASASSAPAATASHDPWTRAVEQAPGVWVVGAESNLGTRQAPSEPDSTTIAETPAPHYEPATAQVPQPSEPATPAAAPQPAAVPQPAAAASGRGPAASIDAEWGLATDPAAASPAPASPSVGSSAPTTGGPTPAGPVPHGTAGSGPATHGTTPTGTVQPGRGPEPVRDTEREPAYAMAGAATQAAPPQPSSAGTAATTTAAAAAARQSLYQRLSNSPEAEAGRAKAPSRAVVAAAADVQDIPSADDETIEESGVFGRAAIERILGGKLIEERSLDGSPLPPRY
ncbi:MAG: polymerase subunit gamma and tau [Pseudarthrobacter sp.]|nr:polymerase subunit gamma and tau [Pseudarthrobacter sp.]